MAVNPLSALYPVEDVRAIAKHRVVRAEAPHRLAFEKPNESGGPVAVRDIEQLARRPTKLRRHASPCVEEPASVIDRQPPFTIRNPWPLALQPSPGV